MLGVAQGVGSEFKPQYCKKKKKFYYSEVCLGSTHKEMGECMEGKRERKMKRERGREKRGVREGEGKRSERERHRTCKEKEHASMHKREQGP
jgi:hypothetical protein